MKTAEDPKPAPPDARGSSSNFQQRDTCNRNLRYGSVSGNLPTSSGAHQSIDMRRSKVRSTEKNLSVIARGVQPLQIVFKELTYVVSLKKKGRRKDRKGTNKKVILDHLSGVFRPGKITAIMGPSGAGKTSLLDALAGNLLGGAISGQVLVNGQDYTGKRIKEVSGFVFQDDVLLDTMTVREAIEMSALLRLPKSVSRQERKVRVEDIIQLLHLQGCQNTMIGSSSKKGISGGERKRTCTAMELIAAPPMIFLDEPTSGLDTFIAYTVIKSLSNLAKKGLTVIATIHQPSSEIFHLFDDLLLMAEGRIVYCGPAMDSVGYFARLGYPCPQYSNPADFLFMQVLQQYDFAPVVLPGRHVPQEHQAPEVHVARQAVQAGASHASTRSNLPQKSEQNSRVEQLIASWKASPEYAGLLEQIKNPRDEGVAMGTLRKRAPFLTQFKYLLKRASRNAFRNPLILFTQIFKAVFIGLLVGLVYLDSNQYSVSVQIRNKSGALYFLALNVFFSSAFSVLSVFYVEKQVFFREYKAGYYTTTPYFFSKVLVELPINFVFPYFMVLIAYYMVGFNPPFSDYLMSATFVALASIGGISLGMLIASIFDQLEVILAVTPIILLPLLLYSGIFVSSGSTPSYLSWIKYVSSVYYSFTGMLEVEFNRTFPNCDGTVEECAGSIAFEQLDLPYTFPIGVNVVFGVTIWIVLTLAAYILLALLTRIRYSSS